jgi:elongation factor P--beta-lysine ligase
MPMSAGIAVGVDRLQAALCGQPGIGRTSLT